MPMMPVRLSPSQLPVPFVLSRPRALAPAAFQRHHFTPSPCFTAATPLAYLRSPYILPAFHLVSCAYPPTPTARRGTIESLTAPPRREPFRLAPEP